VAARSKAWTVFALSNTGIVGSNLTCTDVSVRLFCVYIVLCVGNGLATGWSSVQGVLPTVYRIKKLKKRPRSNKGLWSHRQIDTYTDSIHYYKTVPSRGSSVGKATIYGMDDRGVGVRVPVRTRIFSSPRRPDRLRGPPSLLSNGYRGIFPQG
jgi:hypothetical protein